MILAIFAVGIPVSGALTIRSTEAHGRLRTLGVDAIRRALGLTAGLGRVHLELVPLALVAEGVVLDDPIYGRLADAEEIRIRPSFGALLRGAVDLEEVTLDGANIRLLVRDGQIRNLPRLEGGSTGGPMTLPFHALQVRRSSFALEAEPFGSGALTGVDVTVLGEPGGLVDIEAQVSGGRWTREGETETVSGVRAHVRVRDTRLEIPEARLEVGPLRATLDDAVVPLPPTDPREGGYSGRLTLAYELAHLARLKLERLPTPVRLPPMQGAVSLEAELHDAPGSPPTATGTLRLARGRIEQFGIGDLATLPFELTSERVRIAGGEVEVEGSGGRVGIDGTVGLTGAFPVDVRAEARRLSFGHLMGQLDVSSNSLVEWIFDGPLDLRGSLRDVDLEGPIDLDTHSFVVADGGFLAQPLHPILAIPRGQFRGRWSIRPDGIRFSELVGDLPHSRIHGEVLLGFQNQLRVSARAAPADLRDLTPLAGFHFGGLGEATCEITGTFQAPHVAGHVRADDFEFDAFRLGRVESDAVLDPDGMGVIFPHVVAVKNESLYGADDLVLDFRHGRFRMEGDVQLERMELRDFYEVFGFEHDDRFVAYQGVATGHAPVRYTHGYPGDSPSGTLDVRMELGLPRLSLNDYAFTDGQLLGRWLWRDWSRGFEGGELTVEHAVLHKGGGSVVVQGEMALGGALRMDAAADAVSLRDVEGLGTRVPGLDGSLGATALIGGTPDAMEVEMDVGLANLVLHGRALGDGRAYVRMTHPDDPWVAAARGWGGEPPADAQCAHARLGLAHANWPADPPMQTREGPMPRLSQPSAFLLCGSAFEGRLSADLAIGRTEDLPLRGRIRIDDLDLERLLPEPTADNAPRGRVRGELRFEDGALLRPDTLKAEIELDQVELGRGELVFRNRGPVLVSLGEGLARIGRARFRGPDSRVRVEGQYALPGTAHGPDLAVSVRARIDLGIATRLSDAITEASGEVVAQLSLSGPITDPQVFGEASLEGGHARLAAVETPLDALGARVVFSARSVILEDLHARLAGGSVRGRGEATLEQGRLERYAVDLEARGLSFAPSPGLDVSLSSDLTLAWARPFPIPSLGGEVRVERLVYSRSIDLGTTIGELSRTQRAEVQRYDPAADRVALDLRVVAEQPFVVRNNLLEAALVIDDARRPFQIVGTDQRYGMLGSMAFTRGQISFRNATFDVRSGTLDFDDAVRIDPRFDLHAQTEIRRTTSDLSAPRWRILLDAQGTTSAFQIQTRSEPDLPQEDVLMLLAVGMTRSEFSQLGAGDVGGTAALEALTAVTGVDREVRRAVPLIDDFRLTSGYSSRTGRTEPQVSVGKRIADRVRLSATTAMLGGSAGGQDFRAVVDWQLTDTTGVQCSYDNYGTSASGQSNVGCDLRFRLEFE